jgi:NADPH2:quinone reductase
MKAWQIKRHGEPSAALELAEVPAPEPLDNEVRIAVDAVAISLPDVLMCRGTYAFNPELPFVPGQEVCGTVLAAGADANTAVGSRVTAVTSFFRGHGGLAEETVALDIATHEAPAEMDAGDAACFTIPYQTAYIGLVTRANLQPGETLVVLGAAGGTGTAAIQLGKALGAHVIAVVSGEKSKLCLELGADATIDPGQVDVTEAIREATGGKGADAIYDPVGGDLCKASMRALANEGRVLIIGYASGSYYDPPTAHVIMNNISVVGVYVGAYTKPFTSDVHTALLALWRENKIRAVVTRRAPFLDAGIALEDLAQRRAQGKIVICD